LHVVDLDGAFRGAQANQQALREILRAIAIPVQVGGGLRTQEAVRTALELGVAVAIMGTAAIRDPGFLEAACRSFPGRVALGLDARAGRLAASGWREETTLQATEMARRMCDLPLAAIIYTDIQRDGMLDGPDLEGLSAVLASTRLPVIASGGIASARDIRALMALTPRRPAGAVIGRGLYDGRLTLEEALHAAAQLPC
jgi:phosphoribosylformimino-5-aminoimidazole carboxamide ribotide isomerase